MRQFIGILFLIGLPLTGEAQQTIDYTITHDGLQREYILYVPASYTGDEPVPLLLNFHALGSNAQQQMAFGDFRPIADREGFLVAHPQGTQSESEPPLNFWNVSTEGVDDVGFTAAIIDSIAADYSVDRKRVYAAGMSNGGTFSHHLAGLLSDEVAAIASVSGTMTPPMVVASNPVHPTPVMHIHGTEDPLVPYDGRPPFLPVATQLEYWFEYNNCDPTPITTQLPDIYPDNGITVEHIVHEDGDNGVNVEHLKIIGGTHAWPRMVGEVGSDVDASEEIWQFLSRYNIDGVLG